MAMIPDIGRSGGQFITVSELAKYWHISSRTVYRHIEKGAIPVLRVGPFGRLRIRLTDAIEYGRSGGVVTSAT